MAADPPRATTPLTPSELDRLEELAKAAETLRYDRDMVSWIRDSNVPEMYVMALSPNVVLRLLDAARSSSAPAE